MKEIDCCIDIDIDRLVHGDDEVTTREINGEPLPEPEMSEQETILIANYPFLRAEDMFSKLRYESYEREELIKILDREIFRMEIKCMFTLLYEFSGKVHDNYSFYYMTSLLMMRGNEECPISLQNQHLRLTLLNE